MQNPEQPVPQHWATRFFTIFTGQTISLFGSSLVQFELIWYLTQKTGSATVLATASLFAMLPQILLGPIAGTVVDRGNRRLIMIASDSLIAVSTLGLAFLFWTGRVEIWHIYAVSVIRAIGGTIGEIREISTAIASAVEEQSAATAEIARNVQQAAQGTQEVSSKIADVSRAASETGAGSGAMLSAAKTMSAQGELLRNEVAAFFTRARAA